MCLYMYFIYHQQKINNKSLRAVTIHPFSLFAIYLIWTMSWPSLIDLFFLYHVSLLSLSFC